MQMLIFFLLTFLYYPSLFVSALSYNWDLDKPIKNVLSFANLLDDMFLDYMKNDNKNGLVVNSDDNRKKAVFNLTFVKYAAEIAHFRLINGKIWETCKNLKVEIGANEKNFVGFLLYDQWLGDKIAEKFNSEIFSPKKPIGGLMIDQILQLAFSFAVRILLSVIYDGSSRNAVDIGGWQLGKLLSAYEILKDQNDIDKKENGIFPFKLINIDKNGKHLWILFLSPEEKSWTNYTAEQQQYRENFKFIRQFSKTKLSYFEIYIILEKIMKNKTNETEDQETEGVDKLMKELSALFKSMDGTNGVDKTKCAFVSFGRELEKRLPSEFDDFRAFIVKSEKECGPDVHIKHAISSLNTENNTPTEGSRQFELLLFGEPLWNYARVIEIDATRYTAVLACCDSLMQEVQAALNSSNTTKLSNVAKLTGFRILQFLLDQFESVQFKKFEKFFKHFTEKKAAEKKHSLNELMKILALIKADYSRADKKELSGYQLAQPYEGIEIFRFGQILYEALQNEERNKKSVKYDEAQQMMMLPLTTAEEFIKRLWKFTEQNLTNQCQINDDIDFMKAIHTIASTQENYGCEKRQMPMLPKVNVALFELLYSLAIRFCLQSNLPLREQFQHSFLFALKMCSLKNGDDKFFFFKYKIEIVKIEKQKMVKIILPNWKLPYFVYLVNDDKKVQKIEENIGTFINSLPKTLNGAVSIRDNAKIFVEEFIKD